MKEAYAWLQNRLVGRFFEGSDGATRFEYVPEASMLISLSLPLDDFWQVDAPGAFLDGLLPDNDSEREAMRLWFGAAGRRGSPMTAAAVSPLRVRRANSPWSGSTAAGPGRTPSILRPTL